MERLDSLLLTGSAPALERLKSIFITCYRPVVYGEINRPREKMRKGVRAGNGDGSWREEEVTKVRRDVEKDEGDKELLLMEKKNHSNFIPRTAVSNFQLEDEIKFSDALNSHFYEISGDSFLTNLLEGPAVVSCSVAGCNICREQWTIPPKARSLDDTIVTDEKNEFFLASRNSIP
ncbi:hypothetical protein PoB_000494300 [Plakobranchus ocellatus]|uniref:Uncharacterized protein n=1 Tax=Plakobranchus ocellatus TaxID=259542 RepID=A0AAV3Y7F9_9GAST|nr:hypothetical protein PoB_000494300 [Plakobranchus ocellatus]